MRVAGLDSNNDWTFGSGKASYKTRSAAIYQNVATNLKMFKNDWFADTEIGIDWYKLLGEKNKQNKIIRAISNAVTNTYGVRQLTNVEITEIDSNRSAKISVSYVDIFGNELINSINITYF